jgi:dTDP-4-dehydrorhamnose reductase
LQIHIIGGDSYIGNKLVSFLKPFGSVYSYSRNPVAGENIFELTMPDMFDFSRISPGDYVVFLAAISSPDICEKQFEYAYSINVTGTKEYINRFLDRQANVLFFSSDAVIGSTVKSCNEISHCNPVGYYARMKQEIENHFMGLPNFKVFRLSYVFSHDDKFTRYLHQCDIQGRKAEVFDGLKRNVIYINDVLVAIQEMSNRFLQFKNTIFHLSGPELLSRKNLADYYQKTVSPDFQYCIVEPPLGFFNIRPDVIETSSLFLQKLLRRKPTKIHTAFLYEYWDG